MNAYDTGTGSHTDYTDDTDLVATREIIKLTQIAQNWRQAECRMSSLKFCWGAKEEDDSQSTDTTERYGRFAQNS